jgi:hypothetical protein
LLNEVNFFLWGLDTLLGLLLEGVDHPDVFVYSQGVNGPVGVRAVSESDLENPDSEALHWFGDIGLAISAFRPSEANVKASSICSRAPTGNLPKSFRAALIHETGLVSLVKNNDDTYTITGQVPYIDRVGA